jgi:hypothetical protein
MASPKQLTLLAAAGVAASLFLAQPAGALTAIAQPYLISIDQTRVDAVQPIGHRRWHGYRGGWRGYRRGWRGYSRPWRRYGYNRPWRKYGYLPGVDKTWRRYGYYPWGGYEPCANCPELGSVR